MNIFKTILLFLSVIIITAICNANEVGLSIDNDFMSGEDRHYTHGTRLFYNTDEYLFSIAQYIYTPSDKSATELLINDRPYGGWLYFGVGVPKVNDTLYELFELNVGIVGPHSYAGNVQYSVHEWIENRLPYGWDNQLNDEIGVNLIYQRKNKLFKNYYIDINTSYGGSLGNLHTFINGGGTIRFGYNIPNDFGPIKMEPTIRQAKNNYSIYGILTAEERLVLRNIFLDGNTFSDSHSVDKEVFVGELSPGLGIKIHRVNILYLYTYRTKEFKNQINDDRFGSLILSIEL